LRGEGNWSKKDDFRCTGATVFDIKGLSVWAGLFCLCNHGLRGFMYAEKPRTPIFSEYQFLGDVGQVIFVVILNKCGFWGNWCGGKFPLSLERKRVEFTMHQEEIQRKNSFGFLELS